MSVRDALNAAIDAEMKADPKVLIMGEKAGQYQGAYKVTKGLLESHGPERVTEASGNSASCVRIAWQLNLVILLFVASHLAKCKRNFIIYVGLFLLGWQQMDPAYASPTIGNAATASANICSSSVTILAMRTPYSNVVAHTPK